VIMRSLIGRTVVVFTAAATVLFTTMPSIADTLQKTDGSVLEGKVVGQTADVVTFESSQGGITLRQRIARSKVRSIQVEAREGVGYCTIPLCGDIGTEVKAADLKKALGEARRNGAEYVILVIDSPGGSVAEHIELLKVLAQTNDLKLVAYVKRALSAAAVLAMACPKIYMSPEASIGAAVAYKIGPDGTPQDIEEKFRSAIRAVERVAATMGGRSDLWIRGMSEIDLELAVVQEEGHPPRVVEASPGVEGKVIKKKGQILTLTAQEALDGGLSSGTVREMGAIRESLGLKAWHDTGDQAWSVMANKAKEAKASNGGDGERVTKAQARIEYLRRNKPELDELGKEIRQALGQASDATAAAGKLRTQYAQELLAIRADLQREVSQANSMPNPVAAAERAKETARNRQEELRQRIGAEMARQEAARDEALARARALQAKGREILAAAPAMD
jgi:ATP-dependent protease ClpP protease subunit